MTLHSMSMLELLYLLLLFHISIYRRILYETLVTLMSYHFKSRIQ